MSVEGQVDLDALISKDKQQAKVYRTQQIKKRRQENKERRFKHQQQNKKFDRHRNDRFNNRPGKFGGKQRPRNRQQIKPQFENQVYALMVHGFVSDVSIQDILNITEGKKVISVKTQLKRKDKQPIDPKEDNEMEVVIIFGEKTDADAFMREYSEKKLDGKHSLSFSFIPPSLD